MKISGDFFDDAVSLYDWPHHDGTFVPPAPDTILFHFTDLPDVQSAIDVLAARRLSTHLLIGRDGSLTQMLPFDRIGRHAGNSTYLGREGFNRFAIGIEMDNCGRLCTVTTDGGLHASCGKKIPLSLAEPGIHAHENFETLWHNYTKEQLNRVAIVCAGLVKTYGITSILGHDEVAPGRKIDPGPVFPMSTLRVRFLGVPVPRTKQDVAATPIFPVLPRPDAAAPPLLACPLAPGTRCAISARHDQTVYDIQESGQWQRIFFSMEGYVRCHKIVPISGKMYMIQDAGAQLYPAPEDREPLFTAFLPRGAVLRVSGPGSDWRRAAVCCAGWVRCEENFAAAP